MDCGESNLIIIFVPGKTAGNDSITSTFRAMLILRTAFYVERIALLARLEVDGILGAAGNAHIR